MKKILIYGDSNTWGDNLLTHKRIEDEYLWTNKLNTLLGNEYIIYQEGLPGRLAGNDNKEEIYKNGMDAFECIYKSNAPVDIVIISLGTNDLNKKFNKSSEKIIEDLLWYEKKINEIYINRPEKYFNNKYPKIYYILPINFNIERSFNEESEIKRQNIIKYFKDNKQKQSIIIDHVDLVDGLHLSIIGHDTVAKEIYNFLIK